MASGISSDRKPRVVVLGKPEYISDEYIKHFKKDFDYDVLDASNLQEALEKLPVMLQEHGPIDAFIVRMGRAPYRPFQDVFKLLTPHCKIITSAAAGYDDFNVDWLTEEGIWLCNSVDAVAEATADMALFLLLAVVRDAYRGERSVREGNWRGPVVPSRDPSGMTLGILGMGAIGKYLAKRAIAFNMRIKYYNRRQLSADDESDVVSVNCPLNKETENLISTKEFSAMKDGAFIVNTARGAIVNEDALIKALESGKITRAGLDVFLNEPDLNDYFKTSDKVVVQPHAGGLTDVAFQRGEREAFENIKAFFKTGSPITPVNNPMKWTGLFIVLVLVAVHLGLVFTTIILFVLKTKASALRNTWHTLASTAQITDSANGADMMLDDEVEKWVKVTGRDSDVCGIKRSGEGGKVEVQC
ncbi:glycerate-and formate-dehydrogenase [Fusarium acutatum]|uniref:Glycerate-and formate-dehydrogenase n=1 Tax=Fusarium acutatum TaxID=78861 RepID=A0A8H4JEQ1_9HYPO|nr:glycerate-and formate-dehydrogenase [Fusarium acutatum]